MAAVVDGPETLTMEEAVTRYGGIVGHAARRFSRRAFVLGVDQADLWQEGFIAMMKAVASHDPAVGRFEPLAVVVIRRRMLTVLDQAGRRRLLQAPMMTGDDGTEADWLAEQPDRRAPEQVSPETKELVNRLLGMLRGRDREVVRLYFGLVDGRRWTLREIGKRFGLCTQRAQQMLSGAIERLRRRANPMSLVDEAKAAARPAQAAGEITVAVVENQGANLESSGRSKLVSNGPAADVEPGHDDADAEPAVSTSLAAGVPCLGQPPPPARISARTGGRSAI